MEARSVIDHITSLFRPPIFEDEEKTRRALLAHLVGWLFVILPLLYGLSRVVVSSEDALQVALLLPLFGTSAVSLLLLYAIGRGHVQFASIVLVAVVWVSLAEMSWYLGGVGDVSYAVYILVVLLAGLLLGGKAALVVVGATVLLGWGLVEAQMRGTLPVDTDTPYEVLLNHAALLLLAAGLVGAANRGFHRLLSQVRDHEQTLRARNWELQQIQTTLERRVDERTQDLNRRSRYLEMAAHVAYAAGEILDADQLLAEAVNLIRDTFGLYYVGLFTLDDARSWAILQAGTGEAGEQMLARGHRLRLGEGMVGWCIEHAQSRFAQHAEADRIRLVAPELPETRAEAALPLRARGRVLGALTVQSVEPDFFDEDIVTVLQTMADLLAVALSNAELYEESVRALAAARRAYGETASEAWDELLQARGVWGYRYTDGRVRPALDDWQSPTLEAIHTAALVQRQDDATNSLALPLRVGDHTIGAITYQRQAGSGDWSTDDVQLLGVLTDQLAQTLDSARLLEATQIGAVRERMAREVTDRMRATMGWDDLMQTAVAEIGQAVSASRVFVQWLPPEAPHMPFDGDEDEAPNDPTHSNGAGGSEREETT